MQKTTRDEIKPDKITAQEREAFIRAIHDPETREKIIAILRAGGLLLSQLSSACEPARAPTSGLQSRLTVREYKHTAKS